MAIRSEDPVSYRYPMRAIEIRKYRHAIYLFTYPICPRCGMPMEREYQRFCEHCGQALSWSRFSKAIL